MNAKDRAFLMNAIIELNHSNDRAYKFTTSKDNTNRILAIVLKNGKDHVNKEIDKLKKGLAI